MEQLFLFSNDDMDVVDKYLSFVKDNQAQWKRRERNKQFYKTKHLWKTRPLNGGNDKKNSKKI